MDWRHLEYDRLKSALEECLPLAQSWQADVYRVVREPFVNEVDVLRGWGSLRAGGRWTTREGLETLYCGLDPETAVTEVWVNALRGANGAPLPADFWARRRVCRAAFALQRVLDLRVEEVQARLGLSPEIMRNEPWRELQARGREALTQAAGWAAGVCGLEALLVPSAPHEGGTNLVVFPANLLPGSTRLVLEIAAVPFPPESD